MYLFLPHTDYIMQTVVSTIYDVRYVPVLSHTDYILKNSRKGYIYVPIYEMSKNPVICTCSHTEYIMLNSRDGYIYMYMYQSHGMLMKMLHYVPVLRTDYIMLNSRDGYTYVYVSIIRNVMKMLHYVPVLHTDYIIKNSQKRLYICTGYMKTALCNPAICTCIKYRLQNAKPETEEK